MSFNKNADFFSIQLTRVSCLIHLLSNQMKVPFRIVIFYAQHGLSHSGIFISIDHVDFLCVTIQLRTACKFDMYRHCEKTISFLFIQLQHCGKSQYNDDTNIYRFGCRIVILSTICKIFKSWMGLWLSGEPSHGRIKTIMPFGCEW